MHSGGHQKLDAEIIYIEEREEKAIDIFKGIFGRDPESVSCPCCGKDYLYDEIVDPEIESGSFVVTKQDIEAWNSK